MKIKISKEFPYQFLFALCIIIPYINIYEITFLIWLITLLITIKKSYSKTIFNYTFPFLVILFIAFFMGVFKGYKLFLMIRDFTYLVKPILGMLIGYQLCRSTNINPIKTLINTGLLIAVAHLSIVFYSISIHHVAQIHALRSYGGYFSDYEVYALVFLIFSNKFQIQISKKKFYFFVLLLSLSVFLYFSRTNYLQFGILFLSLKGFYKLNRKTITILSSILLISVIGYTYIYNMNLKRNGHGLEGLLYKRKNAPIEPFKTRVNKNDWQDFNDNYRSYENIITVRQVSREGISAILFGKGMGATVDIGRKILTNDGTYIRHAPILHNAYFTVFLKSGLIGVLFCFYSIYLLFKHKKSEDEIIISINQVLIATGVFLVLANWVLLGLYLKLDNKAIIIGFLLAYRELLQKKDNIQLQ
jgi:hypothetical protein